MRKLVGICVVSFFLFCAVSEQAGASITVPDAVTAVFAAETCNRPPQVPCEDPGTSATFDLNFPDGFQEIGSADASTIGPLASVQGVAAVGTNPAIARIFTQSEVQWDALVVPVGPGIGLPVGLVPVILDMSAVTHASGEAAIARAGVSSPLGSISACATAGDIDPDACGGVGTDTGLVQLTGNVRPDSFLFFDATAQGSALTTDFGQSKYDAIADPFLLIADELIPGTDINFRDAFEILLSPGVIQKLPGPSSVPEPSALSLLVLALPAALLRRRRRH